MQRWAAQSWNNNIRIQILCLWKWCDALFKGDQVIVLLQANKTTKTAAAVMTKSRTVKGQEHQICAGSDWRVDQGNKGGAGSHFSAVDIYQAYCCCVALVYYDFALAGHQATWDSWITSVLSLKSICVPCGHPAGQLSHTWKAWETASPPKLLK